MPKTIAEVSIDTKVIMERLKTMKQGELVTYDELSQLVGRGVRAGQPAYGSLQSARRMLLNGNHGVRMSFSVVPKEGIVRMTDSVIANSGTSTFCRIRRVANKGAAILASVQKFDDLPNEDKIHQNTAISLLGAIKQATHAKSIERIEKAVEKSAGQPIAIGKTLALFSGE